MLRRVCVSFFLSIGFSLYFAGLAASDDGVKLITYYPSPYGQYEDLRTRRFALGDNAMDPEKLNWDASDVLTTCTFDGCTTVLGTWTALVTENPIGNLSGREYNFGQDGVFWIMSGPDEGGDPVSNADGDNVIGWNQTGGFAGREIYLYGDAFIGRDDKDWLRKDILVSGRAAVGFTGHPTIGTLEVKDTDGSTQYEVLVQDLVTNKPILALDSNGVPWLLENDEDIFRILYNGVDIGNRKVSVLKEGGVVVGNSASLEAVAEVFNRPVLFVGDSTTGSRAGLIPVDMLGNACLELINQGGDASYIDFVVNSSNDWDGRVAYRTGPANYLGLWGRMGDLARPDFAIMDNGSVRVNDMGGLPDSYKFSVGTENGGYRIVLGDDTTDDYGMGIFSGSSLLGWFSWNTTHNALTVVSDSGLWLSSPNDKNHIEGASIEMVSNQGVSINNPNVPPQAILDVNGNVLIRTDLEVMDHIKVPEIIGDFAEYMECPSCSIGDVVVIDTETGAGTSASAPYQEGIVGVVSEKPIFLVGQKVDESYMPVAFTGQVKCRASDENGPIRPGDPVVSSSTKGVVMKGDRDKVNSLNLVGIARSALDEGEGEILVVLR